MKLATAYVELRVDRKSAEKEARDAATSAHSAMASIFSKALVIGGLKQSIDQASNLNETISKTGVIFGDSSKEITAWSTNSAQQLGISQRAALDAASTFATFGKSAGLAGADLTGFATNLTGLSSDLASFYNTSPEDAILAIGAALRGESEPIRQYGVLLDDATLKQRAMTLGIYNGEGALTQQQRVLAAQAEIFAQTSDAQGDFARTADGVANSQRIAAAEAENSAASFGQVLLPVYSKVLEVVTFLVDRFGDLPPALQTAVVGLAAIAAFSGPIGKVKDVALDFSKALQKIGVSAKAQAVALGGLGLVMVGLAIHQKMVADRNKEIEEGMEALSRASDQEVLRQFPELLANTIAKTKDYKSAFDEIVQANIEGAKRTLELGRAQGGLVEQMDMLEAAIRREEAAQTQAATTNEQYAAATTTAAGATEALWNILNDEVEAAEDAAKANEDVADAQHEAAKRADEHREAIEELYDMLLSQIDAEYAYEKAIADQSDAVLGLNGVLGDHESSMQDVRDAIFGAKDASIEMARAFVESKGASLDSKAGVDLMIESLYNQAIALGPDSPLRQELLDYIAELQKIPSQIDTSIRLSVTGQTVNINPSRSGDVIGVRALPNVAVTSAAGRYVPGRSNLLSTFGEQGPEAILPLDRPNRLVELLGDPRIGEPVAAAMNSAPMAPTSTFTLVNNRRDLTVDDVSKVMTIARLTR